MTDWHKNRLGVFDLETTAPDPESARIVSACLGAVGGESPPDIRFALVNPGVPIPAEATAIHGITDEHAQADGADPGAVVERLVREINSLWEYNRPVVAFNAAYDFTVLDRESRRHLDRQLHIAGPVIDPFVLDREVDKYRKGKRTLTVTAAHYGVRLDGAHDATEDALGAGRVAWAIAQRYPQIAAMSLEALHEAQAMWHRERQADFAAYLIGQGKPADDVCGEWPLRSVVSARSAA